MHIFKEDEESKLSCGVNDDGNLFVGDDESGENYPDTPENRKEVVRIYNQELAEFRRNYRTQKIHPDFLEKLDSLVEEHVFRYKTDWTAGYRPIVEQCDAEDSFVVMLRDGGADVAILCGCETSFSNLQWGKSCLKADRSKIYMLYDNEKLTSVHRNKALNLIDRAFENLPAAYVKACKTCQEKNKACPKLESWKADTGCSHPKEKKSRNDCSR